MSSPRRQVATCTVGDCERPAIARTWCTMHYSRWERTGTTDAPAINRAPARTCTIDGCDGKHAARGWCDLHYHRWRQHGDPLHVEPRPTRAPCKIDGCNEPNKSFGYCNKHYKRWKKHGDPLAGAAKPRPERVDKPAKPALVDPPEHLVAFLRKREARLKGSRSAANVADGRGAGNGMLSRQNATGVPHNR